MMEDYDFNRQIDLWEQDLQNEIRQLQQGKQEEDTIKAVVKHRKGFCCFYSESLDGDYEICLN